VLTVGPHQLAATVRLAYTSGGALKEFSGIQIQMTSTPDNAIILKRHAAT
jgi:hypothetical protein